MEKRKRYPLLTLARLVTLVALLLSAALPLPASADTPQPPTTATQSSGPAMEPSKPAKPAPDMASLYDPNALVDVSPQTDCPVPTNTATLARREDILRVSGPTAYSQSAASWGTNSWSAVLDSGTEFDAIARNRIIDIVVQKNGSFTHDWVNPESPLKERGRLGQANLGAPSGATFTGSPSLAERSPFEMWVFGGASNGTIWYRAWKNDLPDGTKWSPAWVQVPGVSNAARSVRAMWRDSNHLEIFYQDKAGQAFFTEWAMGDWMDAPVDLNGSFASDLTVISLNANHMALMATDSNSGFYYREWTADKKPDWSDVPYWVKPFTGMKVQPPAVAQVDGQEMVVALLDSNNVPVILNYDLKTWTRAGVTGNPTFTSPLALTRANANQFVLVGLDATGSPAPYTGAYSRSGATWTINWKAETSPGGGLSKSKRPLLTSWENGESVFLALNDFGELFGYSYTAYTRAPSWITVPTFSPAALASHPADRYALARKNNTPYLVWLETTATGTYTLKSRANPVSSSSDTAIAFPQNGVTAIALIAKDVNADGNDEVEVATMNGSRESYVYVFDAQTLALLGQAGPTGPWAKGSTGIIAVDAGDLNGDGLRNEIAVTYLGGENEWRASLDVYQLSGAALTRLLHRENAVGLGEYFNSVAVAIAPFDPNFRRQEQVAWGSVNVNTGSTGGAIATTGYVGIWRLTGSAPGYDMTALAGAGPLSKTGLVKGSVVWGQIDLAAADLNGDGIAELASSVWMPASSSELFVHSFSGTALSQIGYQSDASGPGPRISAGDLDGDGKDEIVGSYSNLRVYKQSASNKLGQLAYKYQDTAVPGNEFLVGDINNDSVAVVADGCKDFRELKVLQVLNAPPRWYNQPQDPNNAFSMGGGASYAKSSSYGKTEGSTTSTTGGGSLSVGFEYEQDAPLIGTKIGGVRASVSQDFSYAWASSKEDSTTDTWSTTYSFDPGDNGNGQTGLVVYSQTKFRCYFYRRVNEPAGTASMKVCSHLGVGRNQAPQVTKVSLEQWRSAAFKSSAGLSWADVGAPTNLMTGANGYQTKRSIPRTHFPVVKTFPQAELVQGDVFPTPTSLAWDNTKDSSIGTEKSWETNTTISAGVTAGTLTVDASFSFGFSGAKTETTTTGAGQTYGVEIYNYDPSACEKIGIACTDYTVQPYIYLRTVKTNAGETYQAYELDYFVPSVSGASTLKARSPLGIGASAAWAPAAADEVKLVPQAPLISSPSHPDPDAWYPSNTVTFNWTQPVGERAAIAGYDWELDIDPYYVPTGVNTDPATTATFTDVDEGSNFFTIVAKNADGQPSAVAQRKVLVDSKPPQVKLLLDRDPVEGWYHAPVTATITADDGPGSGVQSIEWSADGATWQPYTSPITFGENTAGTTLYGRATDGVGHLSDPVTATLRIDVVKPTVTLTYMRHVKTDNGDSYLVLGGRLTDDLSGLAGVGISIAETPDFQTAQQIGQFPMRPDNELSTSDLTLNWIYTDTLTERGSYQILGFGEDQAGNDEDPHVLGTLSWQPSGAPDLSHSVIRSDDDGIYSAEVGAFTLAIRNTGTQEASLVVSHTVPFGLEVLPDSISSGGRLDGATITWQFGTAWPGETHYLTFKARASLAPEKPTVLQSTTTVHPYYPSLLGDMPMLADQTIAGAVNVLPASWAERTSDRTPQVLRTYVEQGDIVTDPQVTLFVQASRQTRYVQVREYILTQLGTWALAQQSPKLPFKTLPTILTVEDTTADLEGTLAWTLSAGDGVKMLAVIAYNASKQASNPYAGAIVHTNLMAGASGTASLRAGEVAHYRVGLLSSGPVTWQLLRLQGDADLYVWHPRLGREPSFVAVDGMVTHRPDETGDYIVEVHANSDVTYQLDVEGDVELVGPHGGHSAGGSATAHAAYAAASSAAAPLHPLTLTLPLVDTPAQGESRAFLPLVSR